MLNLNNSPSDLDNIRSKVSFKDISREIRAEMNQDNPFTEMNLKYLNSWAVELYKNSKISQSNKIVIADLSFKISNFKVHDNEKLLTNNTPFLYRVYAHHDGNEVLKMYNNPDNKPETPYQVLLFIETDDGKFDFGKIVRVKFGSQVVKYLTEKNGLFTNSAELLAERYLKAVWDTSVSTKTKKAIDNEKATTDFKNLLIRAIEFEHKNVKLDDFSWFLLIVEGLYFANMDVPKWLFETSHWIRTKKYKEAKYWNGDLPEKEYEPAFLPNSIFYNQQEDRKNAISEIINHPIKELHKEINQKLTSIHPVINLTRNHVNKVFENIYEITGGFIENLSVIEVPDGFWDVYLKHVNAFCVGIYNGILELIAGIFDLIAIVIMISKEEFGFRMGDGLKEIFEKLFNDIFYDTYEFIKKVLSKIAQLFIKLAIWIETYEGKSYYIVKEIGEIIPEAITFLIPVLKGSKVAKIGAISGKAGKEIAEETAEQTVKELSEQEAKQLSKSAKEALENGSAKEAQQQGLKEAEKKLEKYLDDLVGMATKKHLRLWKTNVKEGKFNCANCAMAVDRTLGGNPASALPWTYRKVINNGKVVNKITYNEGTALTILEKEYGKKFIKNMSPDKIRQMLKPGQRGIVYGYINGRDMGHVFNVVNENGVIKFLDGQKAVKSTIDTQKADLIYDIYEFLPTNF